MTERIGFIGPGKMGRPMIDRLQAAGFEVVVWARRAEQRAELYEAGVQTGELADVFTCPIVVSCLLDSNAIESVFFDCGIDLRNADTALVIEHATIAPEDSVRIAATFAEAGIRYLDAPVSGGPQGAADGSLVTMIGGCEESVAAARSVLAAYCNRIVHVGESGAGVALKLVNQLLVAVHSVAAAEAGAMIRANNIDPSVAVDALMGGWAASRRLELQLVDTVNADYAPDGASVGSFLPILGLVRDALTSADMTSSLLDGVEQTWSAAAARDSAAAFSALITAYDTADSDPHNPEESR